MTEYTESSANKAELYQKHKDKINNVRSAFNNQIEYIRDNNWEHLLANNLTTSNIIERSGDYTLISVEINNKEENWILFTYNNKWIGFSKENWWINTGTTPCKLLTDIEFKNSRGIMDFGKENERRMVLYHKLTREEKELMLSERNITIRLYHSKVSREDYYSLKNFRQILQTKYKKNKKKYPSSAQRINKDGNPIGVYYNLKIDKHENFKNAYINALSKAFNDLVIKRRQLINDAQRAFINTVREYDGEDVTGLVSTKH